MIQANELRIGNYVFSLETQNHQRITGLLEGQPFFDAITFDYPNYDEIEPIPLTEEWLLKFGFEIEIGYSHNIAKLGLIRIEFGDNFYFDYLYGRTKIEFVHQLQNLYFCLTGTELTVA